MPTTVLDFEELAPGTQVRDQYQVKGVTFVEPPSGGPLPTIYRLDSGARVLWIRSQAEVAFAELSASFDGPRKIVSATLTNLRDYVAKVTLHAMDIAGNELGSSSVAIPASSSATATIEITRDTADIHAFLLRTSDPHARFVVDALSFDELSSAPGPDFGIRLEHDMPTGPALRPGTSIDVPVTVIRVNGSTGALGFAVEGVPKGVNASFSPSSTSADSTVLRLSAAVDAIPSFEQIRVTASPQAPSAGSAPRSAVTMLSVVPHFELVDSSAAVPPCTLVSIPIEARIPTALGAPSAWSGTVALGVFATQLPAGVTATFVPTTVELSPQQPSAKATLLVRNESHQAQKVAVMVVGRCPPLAAAAATCTLEHVDGEISGFSPRQGDGPIALRPGSEVVLEGAGNCHGAGVTSVQFGNPKAVAPVFEVADDGRQARVRVPRLATTGKLTRTTPVAAVTSALPFSVTTYRNSYGFSFENFEIVGGVNYGELSDAFGKDQTWVTVEFDPCDGIPVVGWFVDCEIEVSLFPHPLGLVVLAIAQGIDAHCFGMSLTSVRLLRGERSLAAFPPTGASRTWELGSPSGPSEPIRRELFSTSLQQLGSEHLNHWIGASLEMFDDYPTQARVTREKLRDRLAAGEFPLIAMRNGGRGHVVVACDLEDAPAPDVSYYIYIYDPNVPFLASENTNAVEHEDRELRQSRITVFANGTWQYPGFGGWGPFGFHTPSEGLVVVPYSATPLRPSFPADPSGLVTLVLGDAATTQLEDSSGRRLLTEDGGFVEEPGARLEAAPLTLFAGRMMPAHGYAMARPGEIIQTLRGTGVGSYRGAMLGKGLSVLIDELPVSNKSRDRIAHDGANRRFRFETGDSSKPLSVKLVANADDGSYRTIGLKTTSFAAGGESVRYDAEQDVVVYEHAGPATRCSLELGWVGSDALPSSLSTEFDVGEHSTVVIRPKSWRALEREPVEAVVTLADGSRSEAELRADAPTVKPVVTLRASEGDREFELEIEARLPEGEPWTNLVLSWIVLDKNKVAQRGSQVFDREHLAGPLVHAIRFAPRHPGSYELVVYARGIAARLPTLVSGVEARLEFCSQPPGQGRRSRR